jgi:hypothetical protein
MNLDPETLGEDTIDDKQQCKRKQLTEEQRQAILQALLQSSENRILRRGAINDIAALFNVTRLTVSALWKRGIASLQSGGSVMDVSSRKRNYGWKWNDVVDQLKAINNVPLNRRGTVRSAASSLAIPKTSFHRAIKRGNIRPHTNAIKPLLTNINKEQRVVFCKSNINTERDMFHDMLDVVHVDEKWFYMTKNDQRYYLGPDEPDPYRTTKSKRFSTKVMF